MKIVDNSKPKTIQLKDVKVGDIFRLDECYYMRIPIYCVEKWHSFGTEIVTKNAANLSSGELVDIDGDQQVEIVDCELVIK